MIAQSKVTQLVVRFRVIKMPVLTIDEVNSLDIEKFVSVFGNVIELRKAAAFNIFNKKPFTNVNHLCESFSTYLDELSEKEKALVLALHPDLAGSLAARGEITFESANEQRSAGLSNLTAQQRHVMNLYNERYKKKFGFPFIICARENQVQSIMEGLQVNYSNPYEEEVSRAMNEVKKICKIRILDLVK